MSLNKTIRGHHCSCIIQYNAKSAAQFYILHSMHTQNHITSECTHLSDEQDVSHANPLSALG